MLDLLDMDKEDRTRFIIDVVLERDGTWGKTVQPRSPDSSSRTRLISDDPRWEARVSFEYEKDSSGELWDLFELFAYGQRRITAAMRGDELKLRYYIPGAWEPIFLCFDPGDTTPLRPEWPN
jgi:hypothetical protein